MIFMKIVAAVWNRPSPIGWPLGGGHVFPCSYVLRHGIHKLKFCLRSGQMITLVHCSAKARVSGQSALCPDRLPSDGEKKQRR